MNRYTVVWSRSAKARLAQMWLENPAIRREISKAADQVDRALANAPETIGISVSSRARLVVHPPLSFLFLPFPDDRQVRVIYVKFWYED
jgi:hypothetical protein